MKDRNYLIKFYNATSTDDGKGDIETYESWLEIQLLNRIEVIEKLEPPSPVDAGREEFINECKQVRDRFINTINSQLWNNELRTQSESIIIMYDQLIDQLAHPSPVLTEGQIQEMVESYDKKENSGKRDAMYSYDHAIDYEVGIRAALQSLGAVKSEWVDAVNNPPKERGYYLTYDNNLYGLYPEHKMHVRRYDPSYGGRWFDTASGIAGGDIYHPQFYLPLPHPPKTEK